MLENKIIKERTKVVDLFRVYVLGELKTSNTVYYDKALDQWLICIGSPHIKENWIKCKEPDRYTGFNDCRENPVYTGDIVLATEEYEERKLIVVFDSGELDFKATNGKENYGNNFKYLTCCDSVEVIGNVHINSFN